MYAVVELKGHQYIVQEWDTITIDNVNLDEGSKMIIDTVLLIFDEKWEKVNLGTPYLAKVKVECIVDKNQKWEN